MDLFLYGMICGTAVAAALFFFHFWKKTRDSLFMLFCLAFILFASERVVMAFMPTENDYKVYLFRLSAFTLILVAIFQKNRKR